MKYTHGQIHADLSLQDLAVMIFDLTGKLPHSFGYTTKQEIVDHLHEKPRTSY